MEIEEVKNHFRQLSRIKNRIDLKRENIIHLRDMAQSVKGLEIKEKVQTSNPTSSAIENSVIKIRELEEELEKDVIEFQEKYKEIADTMELIGNEDGYSVIYRRYILNQTWEQIAYEMNFSMRSIHYIHGRVLQDLSKKL